MFAQILNNAVSLLLPEKVNHQFAPTVFQPPETLTSDESIEFGVLPLVMVRSPKTPTTREDGTYTDVITSSEVTRTYTVINLSQAELDANLLIAQGIAWNEIQAHRDLLKFNGVFVQNKWIHSDPDSRTQWLALNMLGAGIPAVDWTTRDGTTITTTAALAQEVFTATLTLDMTVFSIAKLHAAAMRLQADPSTYDFSTGNGTTIPDWPATYIEAV